MSKVYEGKTCHKQFDFEAMYYNDRTSYPQHCANCEPYASLMLCGCHILSVNDLNICLKCGVLYDEDYLKNPHGLNGLW